MCSYTKYLSEPKYQFLIGKPENAGIKHLNGSKPFIECSNTVDNVYENIGDYSSTRKKNLIVLMTWLQTLWVTKNFKLS